MLKFLIIFTLLALVLLNTCSLAKKKKITVPEKGNGYPFSQITSLFLINKT